MVKDYRSKARIYSDILESILEQGYAKPTKIMVDANLSYDRLVKYLGVLLEKGLVKRLEGSETAYVVTEKGQEYLSEFKRFEKFAAAFGLQL
ncbi:MAG: winged helix-turn-helix domain-containing protein [Candidatus Caldarchaeum sp.]|nr:winged helix-turn-helix domain-containing protein [Candidatus Caldarchaeum sp.]MDW7978627.1 winged helix-turn-helix domain-containing protein [Candidatus Caldarchaeum sp.]MDW8360665.1 winged helix-turn-helix domain-containing protein [Candidatus Caldarchaeum sp.]